MAAGPRSCVDCGAISATAIVDDAAVCDRCFDRRLAARTGHPELPDPPPDLEVVGPDGRAHRLRCRLRRSPTGVMAEAEEVDAAPGEGYRFSLLGRHEVDVGRLVAALQEQVQDGIGQLYLRASEHHAGPALDGDEVVGRLVWAGDERPHHVVVDGRTLTWDEFGRVLESFEGRTFHLHIGDVSELVEEADADVIPLPVPEPRPFDTVGEPAFSDEDDEELFRQWDEADHEAVALVREALPEVVAAELPHEALSAAAARVRVGVETRAWPYRHVGAAAGWEGSPPDDDVDLWLAAAGALVSMQEDSGMGAESDSMLIALEHDDWLGAVVGLVRAGVGGRAEPRDLVRHVNDTPEVDGEVDPDDAAIIEGAFELILPVWEAVGALDAGRRLTPLGWWGLPRALAWAWHGGFDDRTDR